MTPHLFAMMQPSGQGSSGLIITLWWIVGFGAIFYFILFRPQRQQQKQHEAMIKALKRGDEIITAGGIVGEIVHVKDNRITIKSGEAKLVIERDRIAKVVTRKEEPAAT